MCPLERSRSLGKKDLLISDLPDVKKFFIFQYKGLFFKNILKKIKMMFSFFFDQNVRFLCTYFCTYASPVILFSLLLVDNSPTRNEAFVTFLQRAAGEGT